MPNDQPPARPADKSQRHLSPYQCKAKSEFEADFQCDSEYEYEYVYESVVRPPAMGATVFASCNYFSALARNLKFIS